MKRRKAEHWSIKLALRLTKTKGGLTKTIGRNFDVILQQKLRKYGKQDIKSWEEGVKSSKGYFAPVGCFC